MAQCPKCGEPVRDLKWFSKIIVAAWGKNVELDCPGCGVALVVKEPVKPGIFYTLIVILVTIILFTIFHRIFHTGTPSESWLYRLLLYVFLLDLLYLIAKAFGVKLEESPPPKKFYDPDRLE